MYLNGFSRPLALVSLIIISMLPTTTIAQTSVDGYFLSELEFNPTNPDRFAEVVDIPTGQLSISHTDLVIPGHAGLDIKLVRSYNSPGSYKWKRTTYTRIGNGWEMHLGYIRHTDWGKQSGAVDWNDIGFVHNESGIAACKFGSYSENYSLSWKNPSLYTAEGNSVALYNSTDSSYSFKTMSGWRGGCGATGYIMYSPEGLKYFFDKRIGNRWVVSKIEDQYGNYIAIKYANGTDLIIQNISGSDGRSVSLTYSTTNGVQMLNSVVAGDAEIRYYQDSYHNLVSVTQSGRNLWKYQYEDYQNKHQAFYLNKITTESSGQISYQWGKNRKYLYNSRAVTKRITGGSLPKSTTTYTETTPNTGWSSRIAVQINDGKRCIEHNSWTYIGTYGRSENYWIALDRKPSSVVTYDSNTCTGTPIEKVTYLWNKKKISNQIAVRGTPNEASDLQPYVNSIGIFRPTLVKKVIEREKVQYITEYKNHTEWGNPKNIDEKSINMVSGVTMTERSNTYSYKTGTFRQTLEPVLSSKVINPKTSKLESYVNYGYNSKLELTSQNNNGLTSQLTYDSRGNLHTTRKGEANTHTTYYENYFRGKPITVRDNLGTISTTTYDSLGKVRSLTINGTGTILYDYYPDQRIKSITPALGNKISYSYGPKYHQVNYGKLRVRTNLDGLMRPKLRQSTDLETNEHRYVKTNYDIYGNIAFQSIASNSSNPTVGSSNTYDALGRLTRQITPTGTIRTEFKPGARIRIINGRKIASFVQHKSYGSPDYQNIIRTEDPSSNGTIITRIDRDTVGRVLSVAQGSGNNQDKRINYTYHGTYWDLTKKIQYPQFTLHSDWDRYGNQIWSRVNSSGTTYYTYDSRSRLTKINYPSGTSDASFTYTPDNKILTAANGHSKWTYEYNSAGLIKSQKLTTNGRVFNFTYGYDAQLNLANFNNQAGNRWVSYKPNAFGEPTKAGAFVSNVKYHPQGQMKSFKYANGIEYALDLHANSVAIGNIKGKAGSQIFINKTYNYDANLNTTSIVDSVNPNYSVSNLKYDGLDRLERANSNAWGGQITFKYDKFGNIQEKSLPNKLIAYEYDSRNQLKTVDTIPINSFAGAASHAYNYDIRGNVTTNGKSNLTYNDANELVIAKVGVGIQHYKYDAFGKRIQTIKSTRVNYEIYDANDKLLYTETSKGVKTSKIYLGNQLVASVESNTPRYVHFDALGSTIGVSDINKKMTYQHYYPYGKRVGNDVDGNDQWYTGKQFDTFTNLAYHGARYYDPEVGRFYSDDPLGFRGVHSFSRYGYANTNPYKYVDLDGLDSDHVTTTPKTCEVDECMTVYGDVEDNAQKGQQTQPHLFKDIGALIDDPAKFAQCTIDCASEVFDLGTAGKAGVAASGLNVLPAPGKPGGATPGTSPASRFFRWLFGDARFPGRVPAPTITQGLSAKTARVGTFAGRVVPIVGTAALYPDARELDYCVATCVRPGE